MHFILVIFVNSGYLIEAPPNLTTKLASLLLILTLILFKTGPLRLKQLTNTLKIRILSETSILYLIRYASIILTVGLRL